MPFIILLLFIGYTWYTNIMVYRDTQLEDWITLVLVLINVVLYYFKFPLGVLFTGLILVLATLAFAKPFPTIRTDRFYKEINDVKIGMPPFDWRSLLLLILYFAFNTYYLMDIYDAIRTKKRSEDKRNDNA